MHMAFAAPIPGPGQACFLTLPARKETPFPSCQRIPNYEVTQCFQAGKAYPLSWHRIPGCRAACPGPLPSSLPCQPTCSSLSLSVFSAASCCVLAAARARCVSAMPACCAAASSARWRSSSFCTCGHRCHVEPVPQQKAGSNHIDLPYASMHMCLESQGSGQSTHNIHVSARPQDKPIVLLTYLTKYLVDSRLFARVQDYDILGASE